MFAATAKADFVGTGDYAPTDPAGWTSSSVKYIGQKADGSILLNNGSTLSAILLTLGDTAGVQGNLTIDGANSIFGSVYGLINGNDGTGTINIINGGLYTTNGGVSYLGHTYGSSGTINVTSAGSLLKLYSAQSSPQSLLYIGYGGNGALNISEGGVTNSYNAQIGTLTHSTGVVNIDGTGSNWTNLSTLYVGQAGNGSVNITHGATLKSSTGYLGVQAGASGTVTVDGAGSSWTSTAALYVGQVGQGTLNITHGGAVTVAGTTNFSPTGILNFGDNGGTLTTKQLYLAPTQVTGTGTITTNGIVSDADVVIDASHGLAQSLNWNTGSQNVQVNFNLAGTNDLGVGYIHSGSLTIRDGQALTSAIGNLGYNAGAVGTATIEGAGSAWNLGTLYVGNSGTGILNIANGSTVTVSNTTYLGYNPNGSASINFGTNGVAGGTLTTKNFYGTAAQISGSGTINTKGLVSDYNLVVDATHGLTQTFVANNATVNLDLSAGTGDLGVGFQGTSTLSISGGKVVSSSNGYLGYQVGSNGTATISGSGSKWANFSELSVGVYGNGALNVGNSAAVSSSFLIIGRQANSTGLVNVTNAGSSISLSSSLNVGLLGSGTLNISNGGSVTIPSNGTAQIGDNLHSTGTVNITDVSSKLTINDALSIGNSGIGLLNITNYGSATAVYGYLGSTSTGVGTALIDGLGSKWTISSALYVGNSGQGNMSITNKAIVTSPNSYLGYAAGSTGTVTVDGASSKWTSTGSLYVGKGGSGTLNINNSGLVQVNVSTFVGNDPLGTGTVNFNGGTLTTGTLFASPTQFAGIGAINTKGIVTDLDLTFDATHASTQTLSWLASPQNITVNIAPSGAYDLGAGYRGSGSLTIGDGQVIAANNGYLGYLAGSIGTSSISGQGTAWSISSNLYVGYSGTGTVNVSNRGKVTAGITYLGYNANSNGTFNIDGAGASWTANSTTTYIGYSGNGTANITNSVTTNLASIYLGYNSGASGKLNIDGSGTISNFGFIDDGYASKGEINISNGAHVTVGSTTTLGTNLNSQGTLTISGTGSQLVTGITFVVGESGSGTMNILNGGVVNSTYGSIGDNSTGTGLVRVDGATSQWTLTKELDVANTGSGNLQITNGGQVTGQITVIGRSQNKTSSATVDGPNSLWTVNDSFYIGYSGTGNLQINNGGTVKATTNNFLGYHTGSSSNVTIDGTGSQLLEASNLYAGYYAPATVNITHGGLLSSLTSYLGYYIGSTGTISVDGSGSTWTVRPSSSYTTYIGYFASGIINITNGGTANLGYCFLGNYAGSSGSILVDGQNSALSGKGISIGNYGSGSLQVLHGAKVTSTGVGIGEMAKSQGTANIDGIGSQWTITSSLKVGNSGKGTLSITNGGTLNNSGSCTIGAESTASGSVTVDGTGSTFTNMGGLSITTGTLNIGNGGQVQVGQTTFVSPASKMQFSGSGGILSSLSLYASPAQCTGSGTLNVQGIVSDVNLAIDSTHGLSQTITAADTDNILTINIDLTSGLGDLGVGYMTNGSLNIQDGKQVKSVYGYLGYQTGSTGTATLSGAGSAWTTTKNLYVGYNGTGSLTINQGGQVTNTTDSFSGYAANSSGNITIDGNGSSWTTQNVYLGYNGNATLHITNSATVTSTGTNLGCNLNSKGTALVDGSNSKWNLAGSMEVGSYGTGLLTINNGALVSSTYVTIGSQSKSSGEVMVNGANSILQCSNNLSVGYFGTGKLTISNGASVTSSNGYSQTCIGYSNASVGIVTIDGAGSTWTADSPLYVGCMGSATLQITNGGKLINQDGYIGYYNASQQTVTVDGNSSNWNNIGNLALDTKATLNITNGGVVNVSGSTILSTGSSTKSIINFGVNGGTLNTKSLYASSSQIMGNGTINTHGLAIDSLLTVDQFHPSQQTISWNNPSQNVTINLDLSKSTNAGDLIVGNYSDGSLMIRDGQTVYSKAGLLGYQSTGNGYAVVDGVGSTWVTTAQNTITDHSLSIGYSGRGLLTITNGGLVISQNNCVLGSEYNSSGTLSITGFGSQLSLSNEMAVGGIGTGNLYLSSGGSINNTNAYIQGANSHAFIDGVGTKWNSTGDLLNGNSILIITNGGSVFNKNGQLGRWSGTSSIAKVYGSGSSWTNSNFLSIGDPSYYGVGNLFIAGGATVTAGTGALITSSSFMNINVDGNSTLNVGTAVFINNGITRLVAGSLATPGTTYTPIIAGTWSGTGSIQAIGGTWNSAAHTFTASTISEANSGFAASIDRSLVQRIHFSASDNLLSDVYAAFTSTPASSSLTILASLTTTAEISMLQTQMPGTYDFLSGWDFSTTGYSAGDPVLLSIDIGSGQDVNNLAIWHFDGTTWAPYTANDLNYNGNYANFTVSGFSGYAVVAVPEPGYLLLFVASSIALFPRRRMH